MKAVQLLMIIALWAPHSFAENIYDTNDVSAVTQLLSSIGNLQCHEGLNNILEDYEAFNETDLNYNEDVVKDLLLKTTAFLSSLQNDYKKSSELCSVKIIDKSITTLSVGQAKSFIENDFLPVLLGQTGPESLNEMFSKDHQTDPLEALRIQPGVSLNDRTVHEPHMMTNPFGNNNSAVTYSF